MISLLYHTEITLSALLYIIIYTVIPLDFEFSDIQNLSEVNNLRNFIQHMRVIKCCGRCCTFPVFQSFMGMADAAIAATDV